MNEQETRTEYILPALQKAGWGIVPGSRIREEFPISKGRLIGHGQRSNPDKADFVLQYKNRNIAVIEAKKRDLHYTEGVAQAKDYAGRLQIRFTYSTNGLQIYGMDMQAGTEGDVKAYPTPDELWNMAFGVELLAQPQKIAIESKLFDIPFETKTQTKPPRYYQENAINKVSEAIAAGKNRILLTLATGTGKTAIAFQIAWRLYKAKWNIKGDFSRSPRILFLADRNILADQAYSSFNEYNAFDEDALVRIKPSEIKKKGKVPTNGNVFFTIFQSFVSENNGETNFGQYEPDFFDFIIIDECHRGGANDESSWRAILEYFNPAVQLGLTATPKRNQNVDTYNYFGEPVYIYSLKQGINDGFLTPFKVKQIATNYDEYTYTNDDEIIEGEIEEGKVYGIAEQNKVIEIMDIERYRVQKFMDMIDQTQKTLVFCATQAHALAVRNLINQIVTHKNPNYCQRVTADDGKLGEQHLKDFQNNELSIPTILTTSQKLSTGVDAPEIRNIVLLRPVKQLIEFKQIVGRGTRLFDGKDYFTIYDFVKAYLNFNDPEWDGEPQDPEPPRPRTDKACLVCNQNPCICIKEPQPICEACGNSPCVCDKPPKRMIKIKLADGKVRELDSTVRTLFYSADGTPISSEQYLQNLFGTFPEFFKDENELREIWSRPDTRKKLLEELKEKGFAKEQLEEFQKVLQAQNSDLYDVLAYVAFNTSIIQRTERAENAKLYLGTYDAKQQAFLNFVLNKYVSSGVYELEEEKLSPLLLLKYNALADAKKELGDITTIRNTFISFQTHLYANRIAI
jgi:type I restriction enzyme, R subunit